MTEPVKTYVCRHLVPKPLGQLPEALPALEVEARSLHPWRAEMNEHITVCAICAGEIVLALQRITMRLPRAQ